MQGALKKKLQDDENLLTRKTINQDTAHSTSLEHVLLSVDGNEVIQRVKQESRTNFEIA